MKLRKFILKDVPVRVENEKDELIEVGRFRYRHIAREILSGPTPQGTTGDDLVKRVYLSGKLREAFEKGEEFVLLERADWEFLRDCVKAYRWVRASAEAAEFIRYIADLQEEEFELTKQSE